MLQQKHGNVGLYQMDQKRRKALTRSHPVHLQSVLCTEGLQKSIKV